MKIYGKLMDRAILQAHNDELNDYGVLIEMYREYREKRRKQHKRKLTEKELQLEFFALYSEKIMKECKGIIDIYNYKLEIRKPVIQRMRERPPIVISTTDKELRQRLINLFKDYTCYITLV